MSSNSGADVHISVIVPVYGTAPFLAETLDSILRQTRQDFEIIVVNDGSPDSAAVESIVASYGARVVYLTQEHRGAAAARNAALKVSKAPYVAMLDSDDRWHPRYLESQVGILEGDPTIDVVFPDAVRFSGTKIGTKRYSSMYSSSGEICFRRVLARECQIYGGVTARRKALLDAGLYDPDLRSGEDLDLWLRVLRAGGRIVYNDEVLAYYRVREGSLTSNEAALARDVLRFLDKLGTKISLTPEEQAVVARQRAGVIARMNFDEGRLAFTRGDTKGAIEKLTLAAAQIGNWRLRLLIAALKVAPGILLRWHRLKERLSPAHRMRKHGI